MMNIETAQTAWICETCYLTHHGYDAHELGYEPDETPLNLVDGETIVTDGLLDAEHDCESRWIGHRSLIDCGEEVEDFSTRICDGCSSPLAGTRHGMTFWH